MQNLIQELIEEHAVIAAVVNDLEDEVCKFEAGGSPDYAVLFSVMSFISEYPDVAHHPKEEAMFAHWVRAYPTVQPKVDRLVAEHREIKGLTSRLERVFKAAVCDGLLGRSWLPLFGTYVTSMRQHMTYENNVIFPELMTLNDLPWQAMIAKPAPSMECLV